MKAEFNGNAYLIGNVVGRSACGGCIMERSRNLECPADSEGSCILPLDRIYTDCCSNQVFEL